MKIVGFVDYWDRIVIVIVFVGYCDVFYWINSSIHDH